MEFIINIANFPGGGYVDVLTWVVNRDSEDIRCCYFFFTHMPYVVTVLSLITATFLFRQLFVRIKVRMD